MQTFNEPEWIKLVLLLADTQTWVEDIAGAVYQQIPLEGKKRFISKNYYLTVKAMAHILERHYYKINRYPHAGKFTIPVTEILHYIREAYCLAVTPVAGCLNFGRCITADHIIGYDKHGIHTNRITILTDAGGKIITAFPGELTPAG